VDEETNKIKHHIDTERAQLGRNLDEIEERIRDATDVKAQFNKNIGWFLAAAVAGGFFVSLAFGKTKSASTPSDILDSSNRRQSRRYHTPHFISAHLDRVSDTLDGIFAGLVAVASDKLNSFVADAVPGFREQYDAIERHGNRSSVDDPKPTPRVSDFPRARM
jgi:hypothetical protein